MIGLTFVRTAVGDLLAHRLRSGLTVVGLGAGVASLIVLVGVSSGSAARARRRVASAGSNVLLVTSTAGPGGAAGVGAGSGAAAPLTEQDVDALGDRRQAPDVAVAAPVVNASPTLRHDGVSYAPASFVGTTPLYLRAHTFALAAGTGLTAADLAGRRQVVVIGRTVASRLFGRADPVGQTLSVDGGTFRVIGVTARKGSDGVADEDDVVFAPLTAVEDAVTGAASLSSITVEATSAARMEAAEAEVMGVLDAHHHIAAGAAADFRVIDEKSVLEASNGPPSRTLTTLLGEAAAILLLAGGIGVLNIMLASVSERAREIGLRKAIGARRRNIRARFLGEAALVSLAGGVVGVVAGVAGSQFEIGGVQPTVAAPSVLAAVGAAVVVGLCFGSYPAGRAARLAAVQGLRDG
jgi:putative ABC transport system permease protein